jgi:hypothetical protein
MEQEMSKGIIIQCHGCGFSRFINLEGDFDAREQQIEETLLDGWRFASAWENFICPKCVRAGGSTDALYKMVAGNPHVCGTLISYVELRTRADEQLRALQALDKEAERRG